MSCKACQGIEHIDKVCRVCELVDRDYSKKKVVYCSFCEAYICDGCRNDVVKRGKAALINIRLKL